jgi:hypothetical protein
MLLTYVVRSPRLLFISYRAKIDSKGLTSERRVAVVFSTIIVCQQFTSEAIFFLYDEANR